MATRESFMIVKRVLARGVSNSGGKVKAAMAVGAFSVAVGAPSDRTITSSKFSGLAVCCGVVSTANLGCRTAGPGSAS